jgi:phosphoribosylglycinamide formyltransferase-1
LKNKIVVFASGSGSNFEAIINACKEKSLDAEIAGLITNNKNAGALERAEKHGISCHIINPEEFKSQHDYERELLRTLQRLAPDVIALAGYLKKIPAAVIRVYENRIFNIHPSLLPAYGGKGFYGLKVHKTVLENGESETGCSVHLVTEEYDEGRVIAFEKVPVYKNDTPETLAKRVLQKEHQLYPEAIQHYLNNYFKS